jgi:peptide-methionine (S)-S-oxide reductase
MNIKFMKAMLSYLLLPLMLVLASCQQGTTGENNINQRDKSTASAQKEYTGNSSIATFAGGCFWCTEAYFERLKGVEQVISGYAGGEEQNPTYQQVSYGQTGHAEGVQVYYDPEQITYQQLLEVFFATHDPTTLNRQGPDVGKQYRSVVFYSNEEEKQMAEAYIASLTKSERYENKIVTEVQPLHKFWVAEEYHQDYYINNPRDPYVLSVAKPKVEKFEKEYKNWLKGE